jgi:sec-independent protein translocase protein TatA
VSDDCVADIVQLRLIQGATMFEGLFQPTHLLLILGIAVLFFGPKKLPELGKGIGESIRGFKSAMKEPDNPPKKAASETSSQS